MNRLIPAALLFMAILQGCVAHDAARDRMDPMAADTDAGAAVSYYTQALQENPNDPGLKIRLENAKQKASLQHMRAAQQLLEKKYYREAIEELQVSIAYYSGNHRAIELVDTARKRKESRYYTDKALSQIAAGEFVNARQSLQQALELDPENQEAAAALEHFKKRPEDINIYGLKMRTTAPISLKFKNTPILDVFEILSRLSGVNFIFDKDLRDSQVTFFMTDVTFDQFLEVLLKTNALKARVINPTSLLIYPNTPAKAKEYDDLYVRTFYLSYLTAPAAVGLLTKLLKTDNIIANEQLNAVTVRGQKERVDMAGRIIKANDRAPSEVMLNVEVMEVSRSREKDLGLSISDTITFGKGLTGDNETSGTVTGFEPLTSLENISNISRKELFLSLPTATLRLLRKDGDTKILAKPQVRVNNSEKASIHIGDRVPLRTNRRIQTDGSTTYDYQYQDVGVKLITEPMINAYNQVTLKMTIEISALGSNVGTVTDPQFAIKTRTVETILTVHDGDSVIIGGLIEDRDRRTTQKVPMIGEMPVLGRIFSSSNTEVRETDILLTITPVIIRSQDIPRAGAAEFWSGSERDVSLETPARETARKQMAMKGRPDEDFVKVTRNEEFLPSDKYFSIQVYSFREEAQARQKANHLAGLDYRTWVLPARIPDKGTWYRVFVGQYPSYSQAEQMRQKMLNDVIFPRDIHIVDRDYVYGQKSETR